MAERKELREADIAKVEELGFDESTVDEVSKYTGKSKAEVRSLLVKGDDATTKIAYDVQGQPPPKLSVDPTTGKISAPPKALSGLQRAASEQIGGRPPEVPGEFRTERTGPTGFVLKEKQPILALPPGKDVPPPSERPPAVSPEFRRETTGVTRGELVGEPYTPTTQRLALPAVGQTTAAIDEAAAKAAAKSATPEVKEVAETVAKAASKGLSGKAKLFGAGLAAAGAGTAAYLASRDDEQTQIGGPITKEDVADVTSRYNSRLERLKKQAQQSLSGEPGPAISEERLKQRAVESLQSEEISREKQARQKIEVEIERRKMVERETGKKQDTSDLEKQLAAIPKARNIKQILTEGVTKDTRFRPTPEGTTPMAPTPTGQIEDVSALPSRIKDLQLKASAEEKNKAIVETTDNLSNSIAASDSKEAGVFEKRLSQLSKEKDEAYKEYKEGKNRIANAELLDALGKGLAQLAAGWYGLNTGVDAVSGVDFKPKDWSNTYLLAEREYRTKREGIQEEIKDVRGEQRELAREARAEKAYERRLTGAEEREQKARQKEEKRKAEEAAEQQQKVITKLRQSVEALKSSSNKKNIQAVKEAMVAAGMSSDQIEEAFDTAEAGINDYSRLEQFIPQVTTPAKESTVPTKEAAVSDTVLVRAPDGTQAYVRRDAVQKYLDKGAVIVGK